MTDYQDTSIEKMVEDRFKKAYSKNQLQDYKKAAILGANKAGVKSTVLGKEVSSPSANSGSYDTDVDHKTHTARNFNIDTDRIVSDYQKEKKDIAQSKGTSAVDKYLNKNGNDYIKEDSLKDIKQKPLGFNSDYAMRNLESRRRKKKDQTYGVGSTDPVTRQVRGYTPDKSNYDIHAANFGLRTHPVDTPFAITKETEALDKAKAEQKKIDERVEGISRFTQNDESKKTIGPDPEKQRLIQKYETILKNGGRDGTTGQHLLQDPDKKKELISLGILNRADSEYYDPTRTLNWELDPNLMKKEAERRELKKEGIAENKRNMARGTSVDNVTSDMRNRRSIEEQRTAWLREHGNESTESSGSSPRPDAAQEEEPRQQTGANTAVQPITNENARTAFTGDGQGEGINGQIGNKPVKNKNKTGESRINRVVPMINAGLGVANAGLKGLQKTAENFSALGRTGLSLDSSGLGTANRMTSIAQNGAHTPDQLANDATNTIKEYKNEKTNSWKLDRELKGIRMYNEMRDAEKQVIDEMMADGINFDRYDDLSPDEILEYNTRMDAKRKEIANKYGLDIDNLSDYDPATKHYKKAKKYSDSKLNTDLKYARRFGENGSYDMKRNRLDNRYKELDLIYDKNMKRQAIRDLAAIEKAAWTGQMNSDEIKASIDRLRSLEVKDVNGNVIRPFANKNFDQNNLIRGNDSGFYNAIMRTANVNGSNQYSHRDISTYTDAQGNTVDVAQDHVLRETIRIIDGMGNNDAALDSETEFKDKNGNPITYRAMRQFAIDELARREQSHNKAQGEAYYNRAFQNSQVVANGQVVGYDIGQFLEDYFTQAMPGIRNSKGYHDMIDLLRNFNASDDENDFGRYADLISQVDPSMLPKIDKAMSKMYDDLYSRARRLPKNSNEYNEIMGNLKDIDTMRFFVKEGGKHNLMHTTPSKQYVLDDDDMRKAISYPINLNNSVAIGHLEKLLKSDSNNQALYNQYTNANAEDKKKILDKYMKDLVLNPAKYGFIAIPNKDPSTPEQFTLVKPKIYRTDGFEDEYKDDMNELDSLYMNAMQNDAARAFGDYNYAGGKEGTLETFEQYVMSAYDDNQKPLYPDYLNYMSKRNYIDQRYGMRVDNDYDLKKETVNPQSQAAVLTLAGQQYAPFTISNYGSAQNMADAISSAITSVLSDKNMAKQLGQFIAQAVANDSPQDAAFTSLATWKAIGLTDDTIYQNLDSQDMRSKVGLYGDILKGYMNGTNISDSTIIASSDFAERNMEFSNNFGKSGKNKVPGDPILWISFPSNDSANGYDEILKHSCNGIGGLLLNKDGTMNLDDDKMKAFYRGTKTIIRNVAFARANKDLNPKGVTIKDPNLPYSKNELNGLFEYLATADQDAPIPSKYKTMVNSIIYDEIAKTDTFTDKFGGVNNILINVFERIDNNGKKIIDGLFEP